MTETTHLVTTFKDGAGRTHDWTYKEVDTSLTPQEMKDACQLLTSLDLFEKDGIKLFDSIVVGTLVTIKETPIFDRETDPDEDSPAEKETELSQEILEAASEKSPTPSIRPKERPSLPTVALAPSIKSRSLQKDSEKPNTSKPAAAKPIKKTNQRRRSLARLFHRSQNENDPKPSSEEPDG